MYIVVDGWNTVKVYLGKGRKDWQWASDIRSARKFATKEEAEHQCLLLGIVPKGIIEV